MATIPFNTLRKNLKKDKSDLKSIKLALLGDSSTQLLNTAIAGYGYESNYDINIYEADYDSVDLENHESNV